MKRLAILTVVMIMVTAFSSTALSAPVGTFTQVKGKVTLTPPGKTPAAVQKGDPVNVGDSIYAGSDSIAEITFVDQSIVRVSPQSRVAINEYMFDIFPVSEYDLVLKEFRRILKPNGRLVLVNTTKGEKLMDCLFNFLFHIYPREFSRCRGVVMNGHLERFHFKDIKREYVVNLTFPSEIVYSRRP